MRVFEEAANDGADADVFPAAREALRRRQFVPAAQENPVLRQPWNDGLAVAPGLSAQQRNQSVANLPNYRKSLHAFSAAQHRHAFHETLAHN